MASNQRDLGRFAANIVPINQKTRLTNISSPVNDSDAANKSFVLNHVTNNAEITWEDERDDTDYKGTKFIVDDDTGLEIVQDSDGVVRLRKYTAPLAFAIGLSSVQGNRSWFNSDTSDTANVSATIGTLSNISSASVNGDDGTIDNVNRTVTYDVSATPGSYTLTVGASGTNSEGTSQTDTATGSWTVYRDYWFSQGNSSSSKTFSSSDGRESSNFSAGDYEITSTGYAYLAISKDQFPDGVTFLINGNILDPQSETDITVTINSVAKTYIYYNLGNYTLTGTVIKITT